MKISEDLMPLFLIDLGEEADVISQNSLGEVIPTKIPNFIQKRKELIAPYKSFRKSKDAEKGWRSARYSHLKGIRNFAKSVEGKKFHRNLAKFVANKEPGHLLNRYESAELVTYLSSFRTHALLELNYYKPLSEEAEFFNAIESLLSLIDSNSMVILESVYSYADFEITEDFYDTVIRMLEPAGVVHALAQKVGKEDTEVEKMWNEAKEIVSREHKINEDDENYWALVTGTLKKMLNVKDDKEPVEG